MVALLRILALAAMILMPLGMGMGPAVAATPHASSVVTGGEGHCGKVPDKPDLSMDMAVSCGGLCSALTPEPPAVAPAIQSRTAQLKATLATFRSGEPLPPATPPPRLG